MAAGDRPPAASLEGGDPLIWVAGLEGEGEACPRAARGRFLEARVTASAPPPMPITSPAASMAAAMLRAGRWGKEEGEGGVEARTRG